MKKLLLFLLIFVAAIAVITGMAMPAAAPTGEGTAAQLKGAVPLSSFEKDEPVAKISKEEPSVAAVESSVEKATAEQSRYCDDVPLTHEEQDWLQAACKEFDVPYALALGLIEKETTFRNVLGDDGASAGYMQIQKRWHWDRMERLGVTDLMDANGNFRVECDFLSELYQKHQDWNIALTVYNMGHNPGYITNYAKDVMENYAHWQTLLKPCS